MSIPEHLYRFPTKEAIESLSERLRLPYSPDMQDWEWEVADPERVAEFLDTYKNGELTDDEKFTLMETLLQSFEELNQDLAKNELWIELLDLVENNISLHIYTVWYWSFEEDELGELGRVTPYMRVILAKYKDG